MSERVIEDLAIYLPGKTVRGLLQTRLEGQQQSLNFYMKRKTELNDTRVLPEEETLCRDKTQDIDVLIERFKKNVRLFEFWLKYFDDEATYRITPSSHGVMLTLLGIPFDSYSL